MEATEWSFPPTLTMGQRNEVHMIADYLSLYHVTRVQLRHALLWCPKCHWRCQLVTLLLVCHCPTLVSKFGMHHTMHLWGMFPNPVRLVGRLAKRKVFDR